MLPTPQDSERAKATILQIGPLVLGGGLENDLTSELCGYYHLMHRLTESAGCGEWNRKSTEALITLIADDLIEQNTEDVSPYYLLDDDKLLEADRLQFEEQLEEHGGEIGDMEEEYAT